MATKRKAVKATKTKRPGLACPALDCGHRLSSVLRTRLVGEVVQRQHSCDACGRRFTSKTFRADKVRYIAPDLRNAIDSIPCSDAERV